MHRAVPDAVPFLYTVNVDQDLVASIFPSENASVK